jgi:hypothetical protein
MSEEYLQQPHEGAKTAEMVTVTVELHRHGSPVETITIECDAERTHHHLAEQLAEVLTLGVEELVEEFASEQEIYDRQRHHCKLKLECIDVHFETESAIHHFPSRAKWKHVHYWACRKFKIAKDVSANLELRDGSPEGPVLNESKHIGHFEGCRTVWLVKPGPEPNGC